MADPWDIDSDRGGALGFFAVLTIFSFIIIVIIRSTESVEIDPRKDFLGYKYKKVPKFSGARYKGNYWGNDPKWRSMDQYQMVAAMAMLESNIDDQGHICYECSANIVFAIINRADKERQTLPHHVSRRIYQPVIEPVQYANLKRHVGTHQHRELSILAYRRAKGELVDRVKGATHYLAHPRTMLALQKKQPCKYWNWGPFKCNGKPGANWTGFNPETGKYRGQILADKDHTFLAPDGRHSAPVRIK